MLVKLNLDLIQGVPGSGKTTAIVDKIIKLSDENNKVFVVTSQIKQLIISIKNYWKKMES